MDKSNLYEISQKNKEAKQQIWPKPTGKKRPESPAKDTPETDVWAIRAILPKHYRCNCVGQPTATSYGVVCISKKGGIPDENHWLSVFDAIKLRFGERFMEVYHQTCTNHVNFIVYLKNSSHAN